MTTVNPPMGYTRQAGALDTTDNVYASGAWMLRQPDDDVSFFRWLMPEHNPEPPTAQLMKLR